MQRIGIAVRTSPLSVLLAIIAGSVSAAVLMAHATPLSEGAMTSAGAGSQPQDCSTGSPAGQPCALGVPQGSPGPSQSSPPPIVPPITPPAIPSGTPPITPPPFPVPPPPATPDATLEDNMYSPTFISGWAKASLHIKDDYQDVMYESDRASLLFWKLNTQATPGNTAYILTPAGSAMNVKSPPLAVTWTGKGTVGECTVEGKMTVLYPVDHSAAIDPSRPASGYLYVIGPDGGDFHSVMIKAFNPDARMRKTCPGDPPTVTEVSFEAGFLLHIVWRKNSYYTPAGSQNQLIVFSGMQVTDVGKLDSVLDLLPPGPARDIASQALSQAQDSPSRTIHRYIWEWAVYPYGNYMETFWGSGSTP